MNKDPRRRRYVVTVLTKPGETPDDVDERLVRLLGGVAGSTDVTASVYDAVNDEFTRLLP